MSSTGVNAPVGASQGSAFSQGTTVGGATDASTTAYVEYPDYQRDQELFLQFLQQHTILTTARRSGRTEGESDDDEEEDLLEPTEDLSLNVRRIPCFLELLQRIKDRRYLENTCGHTFIVQVPLQELADWCQTSSMRGAPDLVQRVIDNALRYHDLMATAIDQVLAGLTASTVDSSSSNNNPTGVRDSMEILYEQRLAQQAAHDAQHQASNNAPGENNHPYAGNETVQPNDHQQTNTTNAFGATNEFPPQLMRRYELRILPLGRRGTLFPFDQQYISSKQQQAQSIPTGVSLRTIRSRSMGRLVTVTGMIVRASDVKPQCTVATYSCDACGVEVYQVTEKQREFLPVRHCPNCATRNGGNKRETLVLQTRGSKFVKFQELKLQELPNQVPMGHVPRSMSVYCRGELTRLAQPGDTVTIDGVFLPQRLGGESGFKAMKAGLISTTYLEAQNVVIHKKSYDESLVDSLSERESQQLERDILAIATGDDPIGKLSSSIAPEIFGHEDIKRSLLLQLVGGCTRALPDGMKIRGDINICLMGDPGVAKSQLLKHVASIAPRGVYTTGKGSSGVGLTAAVTKDLATGEMALEGGALVLADRGICCIDEFDKMDDSDRTAIHEVMEQQTVSIAKAGIVATLNARSAVLAAANPLYGRYNRHKSLSENVNLPNSLLSRFDLLFLVLDTADVDRDMALARHVTFVHQNAGLSRKDSGGENGGESDDDSNEPETDVTGNADIVPPKILREYIARARRHQPVMPPEVAPYVVEAYVSLRMQDRPTGSSRRHSSKQGDQTVMTARQLLSILRLSQALARLRFSDLVAREDVDEAIRLTHMSKASLTDEDQDRSGPGGRRSEDVMSRIFNIIRDYASVSDSREVELKLCEAMVLRKGFTAQQMQSCLEEYETLQVIQINRNRTHVYFL